MTSKKKNIQPVVEPVDIVAEVEEIPVAPVEPVKPGKCIAVDGDSYASIAAKFKPAGMTKHQYAQELFVVNGGKPIVAGTVIEL